MKRDTVLHNLSAITLAIMTATQTVSAQVNDDVDNGSDEVNEEKMFEQIIVTGSRISRPDFVSASPIVSVKPQAITDSGRVTIDDYLREMPQFTAGTGDFSNDSNGGTAGRATLNLRGLGASRNLVLMDGQRLMSSGTDGAIDINTIPSLAVGGIEIVSGGASATYGSDALSGVINFTSRRDLNGVETFAQYTAIDQAGESTWQFGGAYGSEFGDGKGYLLVSAEHIARGGVKVNERDFFLNPPVSGFITQGRSRIGRQWLSVNDDGTIFDQGSGEGYNGPNELPYYRGDEGRVGFHGSYDNYLQVPLDRTALFINGDYAITDTVQTYFQGIYSTSEAQNIGAAPNLAGLWSVTVPESNPFLVNLREANPGEFGTGDLDSVHARVTQAGNRTYQTENDTLQLKLGLKGDFTNRDMSWDIHASYGRAQNDDRTISGSVSVSALQELLDAPDGGDSICSGGYNFFGGTDPLSDDCLDYVARTPLNSTTLEQTVIEGLIQGHAFEMPAGDARFAVTAQFRENTYEFEPDIGLETGDLANLAAALPTDGDIRAIEVGGELLMPLVEDVAFMENANLTLGYRVADYNLAGTAHTYKAEFDGRVNESLLLRGSYQRAVRAPNVGEFFLAGETRVVGIGAPPSGGDPCDSRAEPSGDVLALCNFEGVPSNYRGGVSNPAITRGNRELESETADSITAGLVVNTEIATGILQLSVDYYNISIDDAISPVTGGDSLQQCYNLQGSTPGFDPEQYLAGNFFCGNLSRDGIGELNTIEQPILNLGSLETSGFDFAANMTFPAAFLAWGGKDGAISINTNVNHLTDYSVVALEGLPSLDYSGTISGNVVQSFPEWRALTTVTVQTGPVTFIGMWRYISAMDDRSTALNPDSGVMGVDAFNYFDLTARVALSEDIDVFAGVNNLENKGPPIVEGATSTTNPGTYDIIGRTYFLNVKARF